MRRPILRIRSEQVDRDCQKLDDCQNMDGTFQARLFFRLSLLDGFATSIDELRVDCSKHGGTEDTEIGLGISECSTCCLASILL